MIPSRHVPLESARREIADAIAAAAERHGVTPTEKLALLAGMMEAAAWLLDKHAAAFGLPQRKTTRRH